MKEAHVFRTGVARSKGKVTDSKMCGESVSPRHLNWIYPVTEKWVRMSDNRRDKQEQILSCH